MKRVHKLIIATVALVLCGMVVFIIGMSLLDWNFIKLDVAKYKAAVFAPSKQVSTFEIDVESFPIKIVRGDEIKLDYYKATNSTVSVSEEDGVLKIREKRSYNLFKYGLFSLSRSDHPYVLTVADGTTLDLVGNNGDITFIDVEFEKVKINIDNLDVTIRGCTIGELDILSDNISLEIESSTIAGVNIDADNSDIELSDCDGGSVEIKTGNTSIDFSRGSFSTLTVVADNADISFDRTTSQIIDLRATNADISLERVTVDNLIVSSQNLSADIEIAGKRAEYTIKCNGYGMPQENTGTTEKTITLTGKNNDVELIFV